MDNSADSAAFKEDLMNIARTTLSSKLLNVEKDHFAALAVDAVLRLKGSGNLDHIQVLYYCKTTIMLLYYYYCCVTTTSATITTTAALTTMLLFLLFCW